MPVEQPRELLTNDLLPEWIRAEEYEIFTSINAVHLSGNFAVTLNGLQQFPNAFLSRDEFFKFNAKAFEYADQLRKSPFLKTPHSHPNTVLKHDLAQNSVKTLLTLAAIGQALPKETESYVFKPVDLYWAFDFPGKVSILAMSKEPATHPMSQDIHQKCNTARDQFITDATQAGFHMSPMLYNDLMFCGIDKDADKPIITLVHYFHPDIIERLRAE